MATKKSAKSTAMTVWSEKFAQYAQKSKEQLKNVGQGGVGIKFGRDKIFIGDNEVKGGKLEVIILGYCAMNAWYASDYNPKETTPPSCYAFSEIFDDENMAPHAKAADKQSDLCATCKLNEFGTAKTGRGKACGNNVRLGVLLATDVEDGDSVKKAELATAKISPTNVRHFKKYVDMLDEEHGRPTWAALTEISSHDDPDTQIRLEFKLVDVIEDDAVLTALESRFLKIQDILQVPFQAAKEEKPAAKKVVAGKSKKFAGAGPRRGK